VLTSEEVTFWLVALAVGAVVLLVVIASLTFLMLLLRDVRATLSSLEDLLTDDATVTSLAGASVATVSQLDRAASIAEDTKEEILVQRQPVSTP
jgi:hypothetical protein